MQDFLLRQAAKRGQATMNPRGFESHRQSYQSPKQEGTSGPTKWTLVQQKLFFK